MPKPATLAPPDPAALIFTVRRHRVIFDADLAALYGVTTKALNQAVKRNAKRFPDTFAFQVSAAEWEAMRSQNVTASKRNVRFLPWVFTEHGALMAANVLNCVRTKISCVRDPNSILVFFHFLYYLTCPSVTEESSSCSSSSSSSRISIVSQSD